MCDDTSLHVSAPSPTTARGVPRRARGGACPGRRLAAATVAAADPQPTAQALYESAQARELTVRAALDASPPEPPPTRDAMRQVIAAYRPVVLRFPTSGYCDNAMWLASQLAVEAFDRFGDERDRQAAVQLLDVAGQPSIRRAASWRAQEPNGPASTRFASGERAARTTGGRGSRGRPGDGPRASTCAAARRPPPRSWKSSWRARCTFREERLDNPSRVFFDLPKTRTTESLRDATLTFDSGLVRQVRVGRHPNA